MLLLLCHMSQNKKRRIAAATTDDGSCEQNAFEIKANISVSTAHASVLQLSARLHVAKVTHPLTPDQFLASKPLLVLCRLCALCYISWHVLRPICCAWEPVLSYTLVVYKRILMTSAASKQQMLGCR